jgi:hypothetical protein
MNKFIYHDPGTQALYYKQKLEVMYKQDKTTFLDKTYSLRSEISVGDFVLSTKFVISYDPFNLTEDRQLVLISYEPFNLTEETEAMVLDSPTNALNYCHDSVLALHK